MKKMIALLAIAMMAILPATTWASSYYGKLVVTSADSAAGKVYASDSSAKPADENFKDTSEATKSEESSDRSANVTLYAHALAGSGNVFEGWYSDEGLTTKDSDANPYAVTIKATSNKEASPTTKQLYAKFIQHVHEFAYSISGDTITKTCTIAGCTYPDGVAGTATLTANDVAYTGKAYAAASISKTGDIAAELSYSTETTPTDAGTYSATMKVDGGEAENSTLTKQFTISAAAVTALTLEPTSFNYDGTAKTVSIKSVKAGTLTLGEGDYDISGDAMTQIGSLAETTTYTVVVTGKGNYTGTASATWTINAPTGEFKGVAVTTQGVGTFENRTLSVADTSMLAAEDGVWYVGLTFTWPESVRTVAQSDSYQYAQYVKPETASVTIGGTSYSAADATTYEGGRIVGETDESSYKKTVIGGTVGFTYLKTTTWQLALTPEILKAAEESGVIQQTANIGALTWGSRVEGCTDGVKFADYTITIDVSKVVLNDEYGNQVYPELAYVAQNGTTFKKYETLGGALDEVNAGETITLIDDAEKGEFTVPAGATLDLASFGNAEATYVIDANEDGIATIKSTKAETVSATTGYKVNTDTTTEPGIYIYTPELAHTHSWTFAVEEDGVTLTATCGNPACTVEGGALQLQLQGVEDKTYDGSGISPSIADIEVDGHKFREVIEGVTVGEITYEKPSYSASKWYTGAYTASCIVTIGETPYTLTKSFNILPKEYTDGFVASVGDLSVRFDTLLEATTVASEGDTIYYKGGNLTGSKVTFSSGKNITLDLGGKEVWHNEAEDVTITNSGEGTVTLINGTIRQPYGTRMGIKTSKQISISGNFVFGEGILVVNEADRETNRLTITMKGGALRLESGAYQCKFKEGGGDVEIIGGVFEKNDACNPTPFIPEGYICKILKTEAGEVYMVVAHTHEFAYSAVDNVITATCVAEDHEYCGYGEETLTLTAEDCQATGEAYAGASIEYSENFPVKDATIVYFNGDEELPSAPTEVGQYIAKVTVEDATAEAPFVITHIHTFVYDAIDAMTISVECTTEMGACDFKDAKTATLSAADSKTYDNTAYAASFELEEGFPTEFVTIALEYWVKAGEKLEAAPSAVGDYTVKMVASEGETTKYTLEKDFAIVAADLAGATITLAGDVNTIYDNTVKSVSISSVKLGKLTLTADVDYTVDAASVTSGTGSGADDTTYTITINAAGNFIGSASTTWTIKALGRDNLRNTTPSAQAGGSVSGQTLTMVSGDWKFYNATNAPDGSGVAGWYAGMKISWPQSTYTYTRLEQVAINYNGTRYQGTKNNDWVAPGNFKPTTGNELSGNHRFITALTWWERLTLADVEAALEDGDTTITRTMSAMGMTWWHDGGLDILSYGDKEGVRETTFTIVANLEDLVLPVPENEALDVDGTEFQTDDDYDGYKLQLGKGAIVYAGEDGLWNEEDKMIVGDGYEIDYGITDDDIWFFTPKAIEYDITYLFEGNDGNEPENPNPATYTVEDEITFEPATLERYDFIEWNPAKIEKGTTGEQTIVGTFKIAPVLPTATVTTTTAEGYEAAVEFTTDNIGIGYEDWTAEFVLTSDVAIGADEIKLGGQYDAYSTEWIDIDFPGCAADDSVSVLGLVGYDDITVQTVFEAIRSFKCGVKNIALKNDATFTLKLVITDGETTKDICSIGELTVRAKAIEPVVPGQDIDIPSGKDPEEYAAEVEAQKTTLLKAPIELGGEELATYQSYFTATVVGETVQFVLNSDGEKAVEEAIKAANTEVLEVALSADSNEFTLAEPLAGFYYSLKQGGELASLVFNQEGDKNKIGTTISFELIKPEGKGFYQTIVTPIPYGEE